MPKTKAEPLDVLAEINSVWAAVCDVQWHLIEVQGHIRDLLLRDIERLGRGRGSMIRKSRRQVLQERRAEGNLVHVDFQTRPYKEEG